jgi:precorrin-6B C5,15-methyltransferase / cobalt-precorrin-6B C5,C15-methyltransferase
MAVTVVGMGLDPRNLPPKNAARIMEAEVLVGGKRHLETYSSHEAEKFEITAPLDAVIKIIDERDREDKNVVVMATGDPMFFGIGTTLVQELGHDRVEVMPNVCTLQVAVSKARLSWPEVTTVSLHGREDMHPLFEALMYNSKVALLTDERNIPAAIAQALLDKGAENFRMWVFEDLETPRERVEVYDLKVASSRSFSKLNMVLLERVNRQPEGLYMGIPDDRFVTKDGQITKWPVRATSLAALRLRPGDVLWDLGAGCGALSIEAAAVLGSGYVLAVEKRADRVALIRKNIRRCNALLVEAVHGTVPDCLPDLPDPDRVFIGGGLSRDMSILEKVMECLPSRGRLVANCALMETLCGVRTMLQEQGWKPDVTLLHAAQSKPLGMDVHLLGGNPIFIVSGRKP